MTSIRNTRKYPVTIRYVLDGIRHDAMIPHGVHAIPSEATDVELHSGVTIVKRIATAKKPERPRKKPARRTKAGKDQGVSVETVTETVASDDP